MKRILKSLLIARFFKDRIGHWLKVWSFISVFALFANPLLADYKVELTPDPNPPDAGENNLVINLEDGEGKPVIDAKAKLLLYMPAMGTMPYMEVKATVNHKGGGVYLAEYDLSMGGTWEITLDIERGGKKETYRYSLTTAIPGIMNKNSGRSAAVNLEGDAETILMDIGPSRLQTIGVRFTEIKSVPMEKIVRSVGVVEQDKTHREEVTIRFSGYVAKQFRGRVGDFVKKGEPLFSVYSPELVTAQSEFLLAHNFSHGNKNLHHSAAERLKNLGLSDSDISMIKRTGKPIRDIVIRSSISGTILEISAREGAAVNPGQVLYVIGDLSKSFIVARVFQQDVGDLKLGHPVEVLIPDAGDKPYAGKIDLIYPQVEQGSGTANVRVEVSEYIRELRPGTYVDLRFPINLASRLTIPVEAILYSGLHKYVFVDRGKGVLEPREIETGKKAGEIVEVRSGLKAGEKVVASGTFLLSSEAQLRSALPKWKEPKKD